MLIIPAIDLIDGKCVRLTGGDYDRMTTYGDPIEQALLLQKYGARCLHLIDLDGARAGRPANLETVRAIAEATGLPIQFGGGIRSIAIADEVFASGVDRLILGTVAIEKPELVTSLIERYGPRRIIVTIDVKDGQVATRGWLESTSVTLPVMLKKMKDLSVRSLIVTDTSKDGKLQGPNVEMVKNCLNQGFEMTVAGGVTTGQDIEALSSIGATRCIVGKALYEGRLDPQIFQMNKPTSTLTRRIIPCLDVRDGRVVKGTNFVNLRDIGDPVALARSYCDQGADELTLLDITASKEGRSAFLDIIAQVARTVTIPFTVGGGIRSISDISNLLRAGADKVSIGSAAITDDQFVKKASQAFGAQCIVVSLDVKKVGNEWQLFIKGGSEPTGIEAASFARRMADDGAGELLVNSLDRDGTGQGFDLKLLRAITAAVNIPVIASSGAGKLTDFSDAFKKSAVSAVLAAGVFHSGAIPIPDLKKYLASCSIGVRT